MRSSASRVVSFRVFSLEDLQSAPWLVMFETQLMIQQCFPKLSKLFVNHKAAKKGGEEGQGSGGWPHAHFFSMQSSKGLGILIFLTPRLQQAIILFLSKLFLMAIMIVLIV